ncbi:MAG TPA: DUF3108 domain-containing protein, partial [Verrucomicrobiae bacterium]|nr:DUF3108 domain-containing protein [Verrucomicrobiae bacterium]
MQLKWWRWLPLVCAVPAAPQSVQFPAHETFYYTIEWRLITAGRAALRWTAPAQTGGPWQASLHLESVGLVSKLFHVDDDYHVNLSQAFCAQSSQMSSQEGRREHETHIVFDSATHKATYVERDRVKNTVFLAQQTDIPACVHDIIGGLFFLRTLNLEPQQSAEVPMSDGKKSVMARVEAQAREEIKTPAGTFKTIRYEAYLFNNVLYSR